ncbi:hypothetical protein AMJ85_07600 [candidate division BRC1 bacterium SM23_51]|nr:MAG: hypothetical protein AMJ85_07600 [candidate division BRC1 bacterium SM23_51]
MFLLLLAVYLAFSGDRYDDFQASDEAVMFQTTVALVEQGSLRPRLDERYAGQEGKYGLGQSLAAVPLYLVARPLMRTLPESVWPAAVAFPLACATNALICALIGAMFFAVGRRLAYGRRAAIAGALVVGAATIIAPYSKSFFSEPLVALCLLGAAGVFAGPSGEMPSPPAWFRAGAWLALAILTRIDNVVIVPVFLAGLWLGVGSARLRAGLRATAMFLLPLALVALFILWTNLLRSGRLLGGGYGGEGFSTFLPTGLFGLLFSPSHGVFWFSPPLAVALFYLLRFHRRHPRLCFVVFATAAVKMFVYAKWWNWFGGWSWGSRFLLPVVPLAMLVMLEPLSRWVGAPAALRPLRQMEKTLIVTICAVGLVVQVCGFLVAPNAFHGSIQFLAGAGRGPIQPIADREQLLVFSPPQSPLVGNWPIIAHGRLDWFGLRFGQYFPPRLFVAIMAVLAAAFAIAAWRLARAWLSERQTAGQGRDQAAGHRLEACATNGFAAEISPREQALPDVVRRTAWLLFALNIAVFALLAMAIRGNGLWRTDREAYADGREVERATRVACVYLDEEFPVSSELQSKTVEWLGYLETPTSGTCSFYTVAYGAFDLHVAGGRVLSNRLTEGRRSQRAEVLLPRGFHAVRLRYEVPLPQSEPTSASVATRRAPQLMQLYWTIPGGGEYEQVIGRSWFYPSRPGPWRQLLSRVYRLKVGFVVVSLLALWWIWVNALVRGLASRKPEETTVTSAG